MSPLFLYLKVLGLKSLIKDNPAVASVISFLTLSSETVDQVATPF